MPIRKREIPFNLWAMSHTYDVLENRSYDEAWGHAALTGTASAHV